VHPNPTNPQAPTVTELIDLLRVGRSELLRGALHRHLVRLAADNDVQAWKNRPLDDSETALAAIADWGPAEDWSDWDDAAR